MKRDRKQPEQQQRPYRPAPPPQVIPIVRYCVQWGGNEWQPKLEFFDDPAEVSRRLVALWNRNHMEAHARISTWHDLVQRNANRL
jgi:hypothetical protein